MSYKIYPNSNITSKLQEPLEYHEKGFSNWHHLSKYPFNELQFGESFAVPFSDGNEPSIRQTATRHNAAAKKIGSTKKFTVHKHVESEVIEVARIR